MSSMIEVERLSKRFGPLVAVEDVSFNVEKGEVLGFLGPNGAGKSTTMKMITGFLTPSSGEVRVCGHNVVRAPIAAKRMIGYLPEGAPAYPDMTPRAFLNFIAEVRGLSGEARRERIAYAVTNVELDSVLDQPIDTLSKGFKRRVGLAQAIMHDPPVLILDEPTDGLDPNQKHEVRTLIRNMARDKAIIISTHILEEVDAVCTRAMIIARGKVLFDGAPAVLEARSDFANAVTISTTAADAVGELAALQGVKRVDEIAPTTFRCFAANGADILGTVRDHALKQGWQVDQLRQEPGRLDDVFRRITTNPSGLEGRIE